MPLLASGDELLRSEVDEFDLSNIRRLAETGDHCKTAGTAGASRFVFH